MRLGGLRLLRVGGELPDDDEPVSDSESVTLESIKSKYSIVSIPK